VSAKLDQAPRAGGSARGYSWPPFEPGNSAAVKHGAYASPVKLSARAAEIADAIRPTLPLYSPVDEPVLQLLGLTLTRIEKATAAIEEVDERAASELGPYVIDDASKLTALRADLRGWIGTARNLANDLGATPTARARLGLDIARTEDALDALMATGGEIRARAERRQREEVPNP
jgi:hypothetical protein